jgi:hypothetical protein
MSYPVETLDPVRARGTQLLPWSAVLLMLDRIAMSNGKDDPKAKGSGVKSSATVGGERDGTARRSGRVAYDSRGNPTWEWQLETGVYSRDVSTQRLKRLDLGELSIAHTAVQKRPAGLLEPSVPPADRGFNPYDNSSKTAPPATPYQRARAAANKSAPTTDKKPAAGRTPADMRKLDEWIKLKKNTNDKKND